MSENIIPNPMPDFPFENMCERHIPFVLLLDSSGPMESISIDELNQALLDLQRYLEEDNQ